MSEPAVKARTAPDVPVTPPQPPAAVDNMDVAALAAMFAARPEPKSEPAPAPSPASPNPEPAASQPEAESTDREPGDQAPVSVTPSSQPPEETPAGNEEPETTEPAEPSAREVREFEYPKFQHRVDKLTADLRAAQAELAALKSQPQPGQPAAPAEVAAPAPKPEAPTLPSIPVADPVLQELDTRIGKARMVITLAAEHPEGYTAQGKDGASLELSGEQLRVAAANATADIAALSAQREVVAGRLQDRRTAHLQRDLQEASRQYPWITDKSSPKYHEALQLVRDTPGLLERPDVVWIVAGAVEARTTRQGHAKPNGKPAPAARPTAVTTRPSAAPTPTRQSAVDRALAEAEARAEQTGSIQDFQQVLALKARARQQAVQGR